MNGIDFSMYVNQLKINKSAVYNAQTNASGNTVVDYINSKRNFEIGIIPLDDAALRDLMAVANAFSVTLDFLNPNTGALETGVACIIPNTELEYYTIQSGNVMFKAFVLKLTEL